MKNILLLLISSVIICSCGSAPIPVNELARINSDMKIEQAKVVFEDYTDTEEAATKVLNGKTYTLFTFLRQTTRSSIWNFSGNNNRFGSTGGGAFNNGASPNGWSNNNGVGSSADRSRTTLGYASFYVVFEEDQLFFAGYRYQAIIQPRNALLMEIFDFEEDEVEIETY